jgi:hypothetical protein
MVQLELPGFLPEDFALKTKDDIILLEAVHQASGDGDTESTSRSEAAILIFIYLTLINNLFLLLLLWTAAGPSGRLGLEDRPLTISPELFINNPKLQVAWK